MKFVNTSRAWSTRCWVWR